MNKVKVKNIIKRILLILIATAILILGGKVFSEAAAIENLNSRISTEHGKTYLKILGGEVHGYVDFNNNNPVVYCVSHHDGAYSDTHKYKVECYIEISGKTARKYKYNSNGDLVLENTYNDTANAKMAFILGGKITNGSSHTTNNINTKGEGMLVYDSNGKRIGFTDRQAALWLYFNYWSQKVGLDSSRWVKTSDNNNPDTRGNTDITTNSINKHGVDLFNSNAENYANSLGPSGVASVSSLVGDRVMASNTSAGPFKFKYSGRITSMVVKDVDNNVISSTEIKFKNSGGQEITSASSITSGQEFYIENSSSKTLGSLTISVSIPTIIDAKIWLLPGPHVSGDSSRVHQNLIVAKTSTHNSEASAEVIIETGGSIKIEKKDADTGELLNAGFKIKTSSGWLNGSQGSYIYNASESNATIYRSGTIDELDFDTYHIYEVEAPDGYKLEYQEGYDSNKKWVDFGESGKFTIDENHIEIAKEFKNVKSGNIYIYKEDLDTKERLKGAGFKIFSVDDNGWVGTNSDPNSKEKYIYNLTYENATEYYTNENGELAINKINLGKYNIYETKAPDGYDLTAQSGYDLNNKWVPVWDVNHVIKLTATSRDISKVQEQEKVISISGYIWEDRELGKQVGFNSLYDSSEGSTERRIQNVLVSLIDKTKPANEGVIARTVTDGNGEYKFDGHLYIKIVDGHIEHLIKESTVKNLYVEFNYTEMIIPDADVGKQLDDSGKIRKFIPVAFNSETYGNIVENGSRAVMDDVATRDIDLSNIATTYTGNDDKEKIYGLGADGNLYKRLYVQKDFTLANINLGIKELPITDHFITQNLQYVKIKMKQYEYKYNYGNEGDSSKEAAPIVNWQVQAGKRITYSRSIYPSDIAYDIVNRTEDLEVYVTYQISITNTTTFDIKELYQEKNLYVTNLIDEFDAYRYTIWDNNWENPETGKVSYKNIDSTFGNGIGKNDTISVPITFKVNHNAIVDILRNPMGIQETIPTKATSTAYHGYERVDYSWKNVRNTNSINANENPAPHITQNEVRYSESLSLIFKLGEQRVIKGNVFEDSQNNPVNATTNEKLGDGIYDYDNENYIDDEGVKVELLDAVPITGDNVVNNINDTDTEIAGLQPTSLYGVENYNAISKEAQTVTKDGYYEFIGVVPGKYYLRFTYGNGKQKICDVNGNPVSDSKVNIKNYKSTIVTSNTTKNALTGQDTKNGEWYKYLEGDKYSVAVDNMQSVESAQKNMDGRKLSEAQDNPTEAMAITAMTSITIENTIENEANNSTIEEMDGANRIYKGFNFGIIKRPETRLVLNKLITNLRLVNTQGNIIFDGNPEDGNLKGVNDLDYEKNSGSRFSRIEIDPNQLYGSTLTISYTITITNNSDVNYYGRKYYWYGEDKVHQVTVTPKDVRDYFDTTLTYISLYEKEDDKYYDEYNNKKEFIAEQEKNTQSIKIEEDEQDSTRKLVTINGFNRLYTTMNSNNKSEDCQDFVRIIEQRLLSTNDDDMIMLNTGVMTNVDSTSIDPIQYQSGTIPAEADNSQDLNVVETFYDNIIKDKVPTQVFAFKSLDLVSETTVTITPPTGADRISPVLYIATGIISLAILTAGIVIIKKKVL